MYSTGTLLRDTYVRSPCFKKSQIAGMNKGVSVESGVFVRALENALKKFHIKTQAYRRGAFVGS